MSSCWANVCSRSLDVEENQRDVSRRHRSQNHLFVKRYTCRLRSTQLFCLKLNTVRRHRYFRLLPSCTNAGSRTPILPSLPSRGRSQRLPFVDEEGTGELSKRTFYPGTTIVSLGPVKGVIWRPRYKLRQLFSNFLLYLLHTTLFSLALFFYTFEWRKSRNFIVDTKSRIKSVKCRRLPRVALILFWQLSFYPEKQ